MFYNINGLLKLFRTDNLSDVRIHFEDDFEVVMDWTNIPRLYKKGEYFCTVPDLYRELLENEGIVFYDKTWDKQFKRFQGYEWR